MKTAILTMKLPQIEKITLDKVSACTKIYGLIYYMSILLEILKYRKITSAGGGHFENGHFLKTAHYGGCPPR